MKKSLFLIVCALALASAPHVVTAQNETVQVSSTAQPLQFGPVVQTYDHSTAVTGLASGVSATATGGSTTSIVTATSAAPGQWIKFTSSTTTTTLQNAGSWITAVTGTGPYTYTVSPAIPAAPVSGDAFSLSNIIMSLSKNASAFAVPSGALSEIGRGYYALSGSPADNGTLGVTKIGWTVLGATAGDSSETAINTVAYNPLDSSALGLIKIGYIATNAMDSPNEITSQGQAGTTSTAVAALPNAAANATAVWGTATKTVTGGTVTTVTNAVALPTTVPAGYGGTTGDTPGTTTLLAKIGTPAGASLSADVAAVKADTGSLATSVAALPAAVWIYTASDGLTHQQSDALRTSILARGFSVSYNATTRTQVTTYFKLDGVTALATTTVIYDLTGRAVSRTTAFTNLP